MQENTMMTAGAILMEKHAACPQCFHLKDSSPTDWMAVTHNLSPHELEKELVGRGVDILSHGHCDPDDGVRLQSGQDDPCSAEAPRRERETAGMQCLEIDDVATRWFLGLPYVSVSGHSRHIQKGVVSLANSVGGVR